MKFLNLLTAAALLAGCGIADRLNRSALHPRPDFAVAPDDFGLVCEPIRVPRDGARLHAWFIPAEETAPTVVVCGGNTGNKGIYIPLSRFLRDEGFNVVLFDYRGFGLSTGEADVWALVPDTLEIVRAVRQKRPDSKIALLGTSLGSVVAAGAAAREPGLVDALVLESVFEPAEKVRENIGAFLACVGWAFLFPSEWDVVTALSRAPHPALFIHGAEEGAWGLTPLSGGADVFARSSLGRRNRFFWVAEGAGHSPGIGGRYGPEYIALIGRFLKEHLNGAPPTAFPEAAWRVSEEKPGSWRLDVTLEHVPAPGHEGRVPVEIAVVYPPESRTTASFVRTWIDRGSRAELAFPVPARPVLVTAVVPSDAVTERDGGWERASAYSRGMAEWDRLSSDDAMKAVSRAATTAHAEARLDPSCLPLCAQVEAKARIAEEKTEAAELKPRYADVWRAVGDLYRRMGRKEEAAGAYREFLKLVPRDPHRYFRYGNASWTLGFRLGEVSAVYKHLAAVLPEGPEKESCHSHAEEWSRRERERRARLQAWMASEREP